MDNEKILKESAMEKFTKLDQTGKALILGILLGLESAKTQDKQPA